MSLSEAVNPLQADLDAIADYFARMKGPAAGNTAALQVIASFEGWYKNLGLVDAVLDNETLKEAKRRRYALNAALGTPEPSAPPDEDTTIAALKDAVKGAPSAIGTMLKLAAFGGGIYVAWKVLR